MPRYFTHYWLNRTWRYNQQTGAESEVLDHSAGNLFTQRGVHPGDIVYVVTVIEGTLYPCGKLKVAKVCNGEEAAAYLGRHPEDLWEASFMSIT